jgi:predicted nucleic acid-binding protein
MSKPLLVDTDVLIDFLRGNIKAIELIRTHSSKIILSSVTVAELYAGVKGDDEMNRLDDLMTIFPIVPISTNLAKKGGLIKLKYGKSHGIGLADAIVAATVELEGADLKTLNIKHYPMLKGLKAAYIKT